MCTELFCRQLKIIKISWNQLFLIFISDEISSNASTSHRVSVWLQKISILCFILHGLLILPYFTYFWFMSGHNVLCFVFFLYFFIFSFIFHIFCFVFLFRAQPVLWSQLRLCPVWSPHKPLVPQMLL